jgi:aminopeptidase N
VCLGEKQEGELKRLSLCFACFCLALQVSHAQESEEYQLKQLRMGEARRYAALAELSQRVTPGQEGYDVTYYKLDLHIWADPPNLIGSVTMVATCTVDNLSSISLDLMNSMAVDSVFAGGLRVNATQQPSYFSITLDRTYGRGELITTTVFYHGVPGSSGFGSFSFATDPSGAPWIWSLSEPYGAKDWWPCKDHPSDKADSVDVWITCDSTFKVGSEGTLTAVVDNGGGTRTHKWKHRYPIATYLVSVAIARYSQFISWFKYSPVDSMLILDYALPGSINSATSSLPQTVDMLHIYSDLFGLYPFYTEKYGHSQFGWGGGMEHQTMTSLGSFAENLIAHELAHQWFGDMITMSTWPDIWLNEGFATYCVALYREKRYGQADYRSYMDGEMNAARSAVGSVHVQDTATVSSLFNSDLVYAKGATVLHMLRHVMGDSLFFQAMKQYAGDTRFRFKTASTADFESVCESVSGRRLDYFFNEWVSGEGYPRYLYDWESQRSGPSYVVSVTIDQTAALGSPLFFTMPLDLRFSGAGLDTTVTVFNDARNQTFVINLPRPPTSVELDPDNWILKDAFLSPPKEFDLLQNYPNPFSSTTTISFDLPAASRVRIDVYNTLGEVVRSIRLAGIYDPGRYSVRFFPVAADGTRLASGVYYYRLSISGKPIRVRKMIYLR